MLKICIMFVLFKMISNLKAVCKNVQQMTWKSKESRLRKLTPVRQNTPFMLIGDFSQN